MVVFLLRQRSAFNATVVPLLALRIFPNLRLGLKFEIWLNTLNVALGGIKPKDVLDSAFGIEWLMDELGRIEHGVLA